MHDGIKLIRNAYDGIKFHSKRPNHDQPSLQAHHPPNSTPKAHLQQRSSLAMIGTELRSAAAPIGPSIRARTGLGALENVIEILDCAGFLARLSRLRPVGFCDDTV